MKLSSLSLIALLLLPTVQAAEPPAEPKAGDKTDDEPGALLDIFARVEAEAENGDPQKSPSAERKRA